jgi:hypothetical protein
MQKNISVTIDNHYYAIRLSKNTLILQYISAIHIYSTNCNLTAYVYIYIIYKIAYYTTSPKPEISLNVLFGHPSAVWYSAVLVPEYINGNELLFFGSLYSSIDFIAHSES